MGKILLLTPFNWVQTGGNVSSFARTHTAATISASCWMGRVLASVAFKGNVATLLILAAAISLADVLPDQRCLCLVIITVERGERQQIISFSFVKIQNSVHPDPAFVLSKCL